MEEFENKVKERISELQNTNATEVIENLIDYVIDAISIGEFSEEYGDHVIITLRALNEK